MSVMAPHCARNGRLQSCCNVGLVTTLVCAISRVEARTQKSSAAALQSWAAQGCRHVPGRYGSNRTTLQTSSPRPRGIRWKRGYSLWTLDSRSNKERRAQLLLIVTLLKFGPAPCQTRRVAPGQMLLTPAAQQLCGKMTGAHGQKDYRHTWGKYLAEVLGPGFNSQSSLSHIGSQQRACICSRWPRFNLSES